MRRRYGYCWHCPFLLHQTIEVDGKRYSIGLKDLEPADGPSDVAEMLGLDPEDQSIKDILDYYRLMFASEPTVNGRQTSVLRAIEEYKSE